MALFLSLCQLRLALVFDDGYYHSGGAKYVQQFFRYWNMDTSPQLMYDAGLLLASLVDLPLLYMKIITDDLITIINAEPGAVGPLLPTVVVQSAGDTAWNNTDYALLQDTHWATTSNMAPFALSNQLKLSAFGAPIATGSMIHGIMVGILRKASAVTTAAHVHDQTVNIIKGGVVGQDNHAVPGTIWPTKETVAWYGGQDDLWSQTWTAEEIGAAGFGVALTCKNGGNLSDVKASINTVFIIVHFTPP